MDRKRLFPIVLLTLSLASPVWAQPAQQSSGLLIRIGYELPTNASIATVTLNGSTASYEIKDTHRGREVIVSSNSGQPLQLVVTTL